MREDLTQNPPPRSFGERVLAELAAMRSEFRSELTAIRSDISRLEDKVDRLDARVDRLEARFDQLEARVDRLGEKVDRRLQETRPISADVQAQLGKLDTRFDLVIEDPHEVRRAQVLLARRADQIERQAQQ